MYTIIKRLDGAYLCVCQLQDGNERNTCSTLDEAIKHCKSFAKTMNGTKIKKKDITYMIEQSVTKTKCVQVDRKEMG